MDKDSLHNKLVREIIARIFSGRYENGAKLPAERLLSADFNLSRGTVRQALASLVELGVIEIRHGSGAYVKSISRQAIPHGYLPPDFNNVSLEDILVARQAIETACGSLACANITAAQVKQLKSLIADMESSIEDIPVFLKHDIDFHHAIVMASQNRPLITAFEAIYEYHKYSQVFTTQRPGDEQTALDYHRRMLAAIEKRDAVAVASAITGHLAEMRSSIEPTPKKKKK